MSTDFFQEINKQKWQKLHYAAEDAPGESLVNVTYADESVRRVTVPGKLFTKMIKERRPEYLRFLPYEVKLRPLDESKKNLKNPWINKKMIIGIDEGDYLTFHVGSEYEPSVIKMIWLLLHEFRHKIQYNFAPVRTCIYNENLAKVYSALPYTEDSVNHVFHELLPYEVDANIFAHELMSLDYKVGSWAVSDTTLKRLEKKPKKNGQRKRKTS